MKTQFQLSIALSAVAITLALMPAARAQQPQYKIDPGAKNKIEAETRNSNTKINDRSNDRKKFDGLIQDTRPSGSDFNAAKGNLFELLMVGTIFSFMSPSAISADGGVGYGSQILYPIDKQILFRGGFHFQPNSNTWNMGATYSLIKGSPISPFVGGGWRIKNFGANYIGARNGGFYGTAGVDMFIDPLIITVQANQAVNGGSTEFQGTVNFIKLFFGK